MNLQMFCVKSVKNDCVYCGVRDITNVRVDLDILERMVYIPICKKLMDEWERIVSSAIILIGASCRLEGNKTKEPMLTASRISPTR